MKKKYFIIALLLFPFCNIIAQTVTNSASLESINKKSVEGTFLIVSKTKIKEVFTKVAYSKILELVEQNRKENEEVRIEYSIYSDIIIFSKKEIEKPDFKAVNNN